MLGAVKVVAPPDGTGASKALPLSAVTVCAAESSLRTATVAPGRTEGGGWNAKFLIVIVTDDVVPPEADAAAAEVETAAEGEVPAALPPDGDEMQPARAAAN